MKQIFVRLSENGDYAAFILVFYREQQQLLARTHTELYVSGVDTRLCRQDIVVGPIFIYSRLLN